MSSAQDAPSPIHLLRSHSSPISALAISDDNERIYSGDGSGLVVITSTITLRVITSWNAHTDGLLGIEEWGNSIITHARDNKLHVWNRLEEPPPSSRIGGSAALPSLQSPSLKYSMDVNALNYCRFSLMRDFSSTGTAEEEALKNVGTSTMVQEERPALIALPNLVESSAADIWLLPSCQRLHAAVGKQPKSSAFSGDGRGDNPTGIIMSLHLFSANAQASTSTSRTKEMCLLMAYESGTVTLRKYATPERESSVEGRGWEVVWSVKLHREAIMAMRVSRDNTLAVTVSADHLVGRYELSAKSTPEVGAIHRTKHPGNGCIAIRDDGRVCAIGGWDGKIRLYSTRSFKPLGTLRYHKSGCQAVEFARLTSTAPSFHDAEEDYWEDDELTREDRIRRSRWLVGGAKDSRVSVWELMSFEKG